MEEVFEYQVLPVIALRGLVAFPGVTMHFDVGRDKSLRAIEKAMKANQKILLLPQLSLLDEDPSFDQLNPVGTVVQIKQIIRTPGESSRLLVENQVRARVTMVVRSEPYLAAKICTMPDAHVPSTTKTEALIRTAYHQFEEFMEAGQKNLGDEMLRLLTSREPGAVSDMIAQVALPA